MGGEKLSREGGKERKRTGKGSNNEMTKLAGENGLYI